MVAVRINLKEIAKRPEKHRANTGLWLDRYYPAPSEEVGQAKATHFKTAANLRRPCGYEKSRIRRAEAILEPSMSRTVEQRVFVSLGGRCVVGIGEAAGMENGITLNHAWGVPVLPGSALKGVAAAAAHQLLQDPAWRVGGESHNTLFGTTKLKGIVTFHDAWAILKDKAHNGLKPDVMTNHYPSYYLPSEEGIVAPHGMEDPIPVPFLTSTCDFEVILEIDHYLAGEQAAQWFERAWGILELGLEELGIGAKTNAGYGRFYLDKGSIAIGKLVEELKRDIDDQKKKVKGNLTKRELYDRWVNERATELMELPLTDREYAARLLWAEFGKDKRFKAGTSALRNELRQQ